MRPTWCVRLLARLSSDTRHGVDRMLTRTYTFGHCRQQRFRNLTLLVHGQTRDKVEPVIISVNDSRHLNYMACDATI